ncbi:glycosyltransferase [Lichenifustis flavocetrariae]|uniref:Glycosyltransferase n=1 Tax=Lichenifustis flavocetrariae TaxID=2949735 RepID=A0AA41YWU5_9HYPH|nr:glycosyltransferase [Lichenifustis flavocetrariae]MCW6508617.1 glycosyltransferase [Lichenifustis flavocetrariae]
MSAPARIYVDETHCGRHVTGLERITLELFSTAALAPLPIVPVRAGGRKSMMLRQNTDLPWRALRDRSSLVLCPGFPPSIPLMLAGGDRVIPYIHDLFLLTRPQDLNRRAKLYMVTPFRFAVEHGRLFLVNSQATADDLRRFCRADADILLYRPRVRNVFDIAVGDRVTRPAPPGALKLIAVGTVEPRKNLAAAAAILAALRNTSHPGATLDIVGRPGWGVDLAALAAHPGIRLHGYQPAEAARRLIEEADALLSTSHDEGLGLPLLEAQYTGLPVIAPQGAVFREVLGDSGLLVDPADPGGAAQAISQALAGPDWRARHVRFAADNLARWNAAAETDRARVIAALQGRLVQCEANRKG